MLSLVSFKCKYLSLVVGFDYLSENVHEKAKGYFANR